MGRPFFVETHSTKIAVHIAIKERMTLISVRKDQVSWM